MRSAVVETPKGFGAGNVFLLDVDRCTGCHACELACTIENRLPWGSSWRTVFSPNEGGGVDRPAFHLSLACQHCDDAPCIHGCPTRALRRDLTTGTVQLDTTVCLGCRYCSWVCPFDAPKFDESQRTMAKCTGCRPRLLKGREPACVEQCPTGALGFGPAHGDTSLPGLPVAPVRPALRFVPRRPGAASPECTWTPPEDAVRALVEPAARPTRLDLRSEWPLLVFTWLAAFIVGATIGGAGGVAVFPPAMLVLGAGVGAGIATLHLGRPERAWRAVANVRSSWLSREIVAFGAFLVSAIAHLFFPDLSGLSGVTIALGIATLFAMDRVYDPVRPAGEPPLDSADVLSTGLLVAAVLSDVWPVLVGITAVKLVLALSRLVRQRTLTATTPWISARLLLGAAVPVAHALATGPAVPLGFLVAAELVDRFVFYASLESRTPEVGHHVGVRPVGSVHRRA